MKIVRIYLLVLLIALLAMPLISCSGSDSGANGSLPVDDAAAAPGTTVISGRVSLSSLSADISSSPSKAVRDAILKAHSGEGSLADIGAAFRSMKIQKALFAPGDVIGDPMPGATIQLFDAQNPEFLFPVAEELTGPDGDYTFDKLKYAAQNAVYGATYLDDASIPAGFYTLISSKYYASSGKLYVAVQPVIKSYEGVISGNDLVGQASDVAPKVVTMFGMRANSDGAFGGSVGGANGTSVSGDNCETNRVLLTFPPQCIDRNASVMVTFNMAMARGTITGDSANQVVSAFTVKNSAGNIIPGKWKLSLDIMTAYFTPDAQFKKGETYTMEIAGGKEANAVRNVYGRPIPKTITGTFFGYNGEFEDKAPPIVTPYSPSGAELTSAPVYTPIRIASSDLLDMTGLLIDNFGPSLGDKPNVIYVGQINEQYIYELVPSVSLQLGADYRFDITGGVDLAGNAMNSVPFAFSVETEDLSDGISLIGNSTTVLYDSSVTPAIVNVTGQAVQVAAVNVFGKWARAMNDRSTALLTPYMTGDFAWINNGTSSDDMNRDGRMSLGEFTDMLSSLIAQLEGCNAIVQPVINDTVVVDSETKAHLSFGLNVVTLSTDPACAELARNMPKAAWLYIEKINGAWIITHGAEVELTNDISNTQKIELVTPFADEVLDEPTQAVPVNPTIRWMSIANIASYAVIITDTRSPWGETGWVAIYNAVGVEKDKRLKFNFSGIPGDGTESDVFIINGNDNGGDASFGNVFGFNRMIQQLKPGGEYAWAVIALKTAKIGDFKRNTVGDLIADVVASSSTRSFSADGLWKEITVSFGGGQEFSPYIQGYDVGSASQVLLTINSPTADANGFWGELYIEGYGQRMIPLNFVNGSITVTLDLYNLANRIYIVDSSHMVGLPGEEPYIKFFNVMTQGGELPVISIVNIEDSTGSPLALNLWGDVEQTLQTSSIRVDGMVANTTAGGPLYSEPGNTVYVDVYSEFGSFNNSISVLPATFGAFDTAVIPVFDGWNQVRLSFSDGTGITYESSFNVEVAEGYGATPPEFIGVTSTKTPVFQDAYSVEYNVGSDNSIDLNLVMPDLGAGGGGYIDHSYGDYRDYGGYFTLDGAGNYMGYNRIGFPTGNNGNISGTMNIDLFKGWNFIVLSDNVGNWYEVRVYTSGGNDAAMFFDNMTILGDQSYMNLMWSDNWMRSYDTDTDSVTITFTDLYLEAFGMQDYAYVDVYTDYGYNSTMPMSDMSGNFNLNIPLSPGYNQVMVYVPMSGGNYLFEFWTTGGAAGGTRYLDINPPHNSSVAGLYRVDIHADNTIDGMYMPDDPWAVNVSIYNYDMMYTEASGSIVDWPMFTGWGSGWSPPMWGIGIDYWFDYDFMPGMMYEVYVDAYDWMNSMMSHGAIVYYNNWMGYAPNYYKASQGKAGISADGVRASKIYKNKSKVRAQRLIDRATKERQQ